jgi:uncharacterized membrane protein
METERGVERLIFFTDAVAAIAITLLILPLVDSVPSFAHSHTVWEFIVANLSQLFAFALSFLIIARLWLSNHHILARTVRATSALMWLDISWAFTIVLLPLPTEISAVFPSSELSVCIYIGCSLASMLLLSGLAWYLHRHPELQRDRMRLTGMQVWGIASSAGGFALALILVLIFPRITYYSLLVLLLATPVGYLVRPRIKRRDAERAAADAALVTPEP